MCHQYQPLKIFQNCEIQHVIINYFKNILDWQTFRSFTKVVGIHIFVENLYLTFKHHHHSTFLHTVQHNCTQTFNPLPHGGRTYWPITS
jgi:hypothetical protein